MAWKHSSSCGCWLTPAPAKVSSPSWTEPHWAPYGQPGSACLEGLVSAFPLFSSALVCMCLTVNGHPAALQRSAVPGQLISPREERQGHFLRATSAFICGLLASSFSCFKAAWQWAESFRHGSSGSSITASWLLISLILLLHKP